MRGLVCPHNGFAAIAAGDGIGDDLHAWADKRRLRIHDVRIQALIVTAHQHGATAKNAGHIEHGIADQGNLVAQYLHSSTNARTCNRTLAHRSNQRHVGFSRGCEIDRDGHRNGLRLL